MKTLKEFIQRLEDDAAFEERAQAFLTDDELMAFVKLEGYDFTLDELMDEFTHEAELPRTPEAIPYGEPGTALPKSGSRAVTRGEPSAGLQKPPGETPSPGPEGKSPGEFPRFGGGRHRGFSPQRLKSIPGEEP